MTAPVADPWLGVDVAKFSTLLKLAPQLEDVAPYEPVIRNALPAPDLDQEGPVGHRLAKMLREKPKELDLDRGQTNEVIVLPHHPRTDIDLEILQ